MGGTETRSDDPQARLDALEAELAEVCGQLNVLNARLVALVGDALDTKAWAQWGIHTPAQWLAWQAGLSGGHARTIVQVASRRAELPATMVAFTAGELSIDQVAPIAAKVPAWADDEASRLAKTATVTQLRKVVARYPFADQVPPDQPEPVTDRDEFVSLTPDDDGTWRLTGRLHADHGAIVDAALREARDALFHRHGTPATGGDALVELAHRSLDTITDPARRDRYRIHLHIDTDGTTTDHHHRSVPAWVRRLAGCDTTSTTEWEHHGRPVRISPPEQAIPAVIRRYIHRRDNGCRVPGCPSRVVEIHHVIHREDGGTHDITNLTCLCPRHHRLHHRGKLGITGNADLPDGLHITDHHGRPLHPHSAARPPTGPPPKPPRRYRHPSGERLDPTAVTFNTPPEHRPRHAAQVAAAVAAARTTNAWTATY